MDFDRLDTGANISTKVDHSACLGRRPILKELCY